MMRRFAVALLLAALCKPVAPAYAQNGESAATPMPARERVFGVDCVALIDAGKEIEGKVDLRLTHGKFTYLFATQANLDAFKASPEKYEIQQNGACGRMGPLSGEGSPKLFAVHEKRLYLFASEQCKRSFIKDPATLLDSDDPAPATTEESIRRGLHLAERAVDALGGDAALGELASYRQQLTRQEKQGETTYTVTDAVTILFPDQVRTDSCWNDSCWANVATRRDGWFVSTGQPNESMVEAQRRAVWRGDGRHVLALLRNRELPGVIVTADGSRQTVPVHGEGDIPVELLTIHDAGATTMLGVDPDGRVLMMSYRDRGPTLAIGRIEKRFSGFRQVGGIQLPARVETLFEGRPVPEQSGEYSVQTVNDPGDRALFERTQASRPTAPSP